MFENKVQIKKRIKIKKKSQTLSKYSHYRKKIIKSRHLYLLFLPVIIYYALFHYGPMYGLIIAFQNYYPHLGVTGSTWVGLTHIKSFFDSIYFWRLIRNTLAINLYSILAGFPAPIIMALMINELRKNYMKRSVQTLVYLPHFISVVVLAGIVVQFLSPSTGIVNTIIKALGGKPIHFLAEAGWYRTIYVWSGIWHNAGWGSIIYLAALTYINQDLYEAATVDGANDLRKMIHITIPCLMPTVIIMLILRVGRLFTVGFEKTILLYNPITYETADVIRTYIYRKGIQQGEYSFSTSVGLFNSILNFAALLIFNSISRKISETSLW